MLNTGRENITVVRRVKYFEVYQDLFMLTFKKLNLKKCNIIISFQNQLSKIIKSNLLLWIIDRTHPKTFPWELFLL